MEITKDFVLESINTYCTERKYGSETLTDGFKEKFSNFFVKRYEGKDVENNDVLADLHFNLDSAFNASVDINQTLTTQFKTKETEYQNQIAELNKKLGTPPTPPTPPTPQIPKELQDQLDELKKYKNEEVKKTKLASIMSLAKANIRQDLHKSFESFAKGIDVNLEKEDKAQADELVSRFQEIFKDSIGDIKPLSPKQTQKRDNEVINSLPKMKV